MASPNGPGPNLNGGLSPLPSNRLRSSSRPSTSHSTLTLHATSPSTPLRSSTAARSTRSRTRASPYTPSTSRLTRSAAGPSTPQPSTSLTPSSAAKRLRTDTTSTPVRSPSMKALGGLLGFISPFSTRRAKGSAAFGADDDDDDDEQQQQQEPVAQETNDASQDIDIEAHASFEEHEAEPEERQQDRLAVPPPASSIRGLRTTDYASSAPLETNGALGAASTTPSAPPPPSRTSYAPFSTSNGPRSLTDAALEATNAGPVAPSYDSLLRFYAQHAPQAAASQGIDVHTLEGRERSPSLPLGAAAGEEAGVMGGYNYATAAAPSTSNGLLLPYAHSLAGSQSAYGMFRASNSMSEGLWRGVAERREAGIRDAGRNAPPSRGSFLSPNYVSPQQAGIQASYEADQAAQAQAQALHRSLAASFSPAALARRGAANASTTAAAGAGRRHRPLYLGPGMAGPSSLAALRRRRRGIAGAGAVNGLSASATVGSLSSLAPVQPQDDEGMDLDEFGREQRPDRPDAGKRRRLEPETERQDASGSTQQQLQGSVFGGMSSSWTTPDLPSFARSEQVTSSSFGKATTKVTSPPKPHVRAASPPRTATADAVLSILSSGPALPASPSRKAADTASPAPELVNPYQASSSGLRGRLSNGDAEDGAPAAGMSNRQKLLKKQKEEEKERRRKEREESKKREREAKEEAAERNSGRESALDLILRTAPGRNARSAASAAATGAGKEDRGQSLAEQERKERERKEEEEKRVKKDRATEEAKRRLEALKNRSQAPAQGPAQDEVQEEEEDDVPAAPLFSFNAPAPAPAAAPVPTSKTTTKPSVTAPSTSVKTAPSTSAAPSFSLLSSPSAAAGGLKPNAFAPKKPSPLSLGAFGATATPPDSPDERSEAEDAATTARRMREREASPSAGKRVQKTAERAQEHEEQQEGDGQEEEQEEKEDKENAAPKSAKSFGGFFGTPAPSPSTATSSASTSSASTSTGFSFGQAPMAPIPASAPAPGSAVPATSAPSSGSTQLPESAPTTTGDAKSAALSTPVSALPSFSFDLPTTTTTAANGAHPLRHQVAGEEETALPKFEFSVSVVTPRPNSTSAAALMGESKEHPPTGAGTSTTAMKGFSFSPAPAAPASSPASSATSLSTPATPAPSSGFKFSFTGTPASAAPASSAPPSSAPASDDSAAAPAAAAAAAVEGSTESASGSGSALLTGVGEGEEDEETLHAVRGKVYILSDGKWSDLGIGNAKVKRRTDGEEGKGKKRLLVRNEGNGKVTVNFSLYASMKVTREKNVLSFLGFTPEEGKPANYRMRVKTEDMARELEETLMREGRGV